MSNHEQPFNLLAAASWLVQRPTTSRHSNCLVLKRSVFFFMIGLQGPIGGFVLALSSFDFAIFFFIKAPCCIAFCFEVP